MKLKINSKLTGALLAVTAAVLFPSMIVTAAPAESYTVTFRPGNVGYFAISQEAEGTKQEKAEAVAGQEYAGYAYQVTKNGAIKLTVPAGEALPSAPTRVMTEDGYFVKDSTIWAPETLQGMAVTKNMDFVVDYGKLIDGVEYTVEYVDSESGDSIAPVFISKANIGEERSVTAPAQIIISEATVYKLTSKATIKKTLDADASNNLFSFAYTMEPRGTVNEETVEYLDGGTEVITRTETTVVENEANTDTTATVNVAQNQAGANANAEVLENADVVDNADANQELVTIEDEDTALADGIADYDAQDGMVEIEDEAAPLASFDKESIAKNATMWIWIVTAVAIVIAAGMTGVWFKVKKNQSNRDSSEEE